MSSPTFSAASVNAGEGLGFHLLLPGATAARPASGERVVLLHGWLQSSDMWLTTAARLRDVYGHDVLLVDWWGHGRSLPEPGDLDAAMCVGSLEAQLKGVLRRYGWDVGAPLVVVGCSMGGAVALRLAACTDPHWRGRVGRLVRGAYPFPPTQKNSHADVSLV